MNNEELTHSELIAKTMLEVLEERYGELTKEEKDAIVMLLLEEAILEE